MFRIKKVSMRTENDALHSIPAATCRLQRIFQFEMRNKKFELCVDEGIFKQQKSGPTLFANHHFRMHRCRMLNSFTELFHWTPSQNPFTELLLWVTTRCIRSATVFSANVLPNALIYSKHFAYFPLSNCFRVLSLEFQASSCKVWNRKVHCEWWLWMVVIVCSIVYGANDLSDLRRLIEFAAATICRTRSMNQLQCYEERKWKMYEERFKDLVSFIWFAYAVSLMRFVA